MTVNAQQSEFERGAQAVRALLAGDHSKAAVERAKDLHKRWASPESELLLIESYQARIRNLCKKGMLVEAKSLLDLVSSRFPAALPQLQTLAWDVRTNTATLTELVGPLSDPLLPAEVQTQIESAVRQRTEDLSALAQAASLPATHPLRVAANALNEAFHAVTSGAVEDELLLLPQVSRRSPLACWKALIRAIASFYRGEEHATRHWLEAIAADSVPARLVPSMHALLGDARGAVLSPAGVSLVRSTGSSRKSLQSALASAEQALRSKDRKLALDKARALVSVCRQYRPELVETLRQHLLVRLMLLGVHADLAHAAVGKAKEDAYWRRLLARGIEEMADDDESRFKAVMCWEYFRDQAIREKWFAAGSLEDGLLAMRMARVVSRMHPEVIEDLLDEASTPASLLDAGYLFARGCQSDPHAENFAEWLAWAKQENRAPDEVAELWRQARKQDVAPVLWLVESAERRGAFEKSLKFLEQAEQLDKLNPDVRKMRIRLLVAGVLRHFRQGKPRLAAQGIDRLTLLPEAKEPTLAPAVAALRSLCCALAGDLENAAAHRAALQAPLGDSAFVLLAAMGNGSACESAKPTSFAEPGALAKLARTCRLGELLNIECALPAQWEAGLNASLDTSAHGLDAAQLLLIGEAALRGQLAKLAYQISVAGLKAGGADARFLFLRSRTLPDWASQRSVRCLRAALELARRNREMTLAGRVLDQLRSRGAVPAGERDGFGLEAEMLLQIVEEERAKDSYPEQSKLKPHRRRLRRQEERHSPLPQEKPAKLPPPVQESLF